MFSLPESQNVFIVEGEYNAWIIALSVIIACIASYTALSMNQRIQQNSFFHKYFWLLLSSIAMGLGIWSMHFVGMSAFMLPVSMTYNVILTVVSAVPAVLASYLAFYFANREGKSHFEYMLAGIVMGFGISAMHYIGMAAMEMQVKYVYEPLVFPASILLAISVSYIALFIFSALQKYMNNQLIKVVTSILMGGAITSMHYTGMGAVIFYADEPLNSEAHQMNHMDMAMLITSVTVGISILLLVSGLTSLLDRYVDYRLHFYDVLTLFPNQRQFEKEMEQVKISGALAIIHIHHLEEWINAHGYIFGDEIIRKAGEIIRGLKPASAKIYHIERNRFVLLNEKNDKKFIVFLEELAGLFKEPVSINNHTLIIEMVIALSDGKEMIETRKLFHNGVAVLQHPSTKYDHQIIRYHPDIHTYSLERKIVDDINAALENDDLFLVYQPKVHAHFKYVTGIEALLRWRHPEMDLISPGIFIPILEDNGKIYDVTDWVIERVCQQIKEWQETGTPFARVSINIPGLYLTSPRLVEIINRNLIKYHVDSSYIELEITETSVINQIENAIIAVRKFRELGLSVALDDFGTGLSSLSYLKTIPISTLKIDKSFIDGVPVCAKDSAILKAIILLSSSLSLMVVIEGVETEEQAAFLASMEEITYLQGFYFSRPLTADEFAVWIKENECRLEKEQLYYSEV